VRRKVVENMNIKHLRIKINKQKKPIIILICGMPGTRKSSTAVRLAALLGFAVVVNMDEVRDIMQLYDKRPIIQGKSHDRWKLFGSLNDKNFYKGFVAHSQALKKGAMAVINKNISIGENIIVEGVHLLPSLYKDIHFAKTIHILLTAKDTIHHKNLLNYKFGRRHNIQKPWEDEKIQHIERIQNLLIKDARRKRVLIIESINPTKNCAVIMQYLEKVL
jgi:2-phosphoglycerate kinase